MNDVPSPSSSTSSGLIRQLGLTDATAAVVGGIVGAGIFLNPSVVAKQLAHPTLILGAWLVGGLVALFGAWIYAELGSERPAPGGQYAYFHEAFHPAVAFLYGWGLLWVIQSGGMAAVAITFAKYFSLLTGLHADERVVAALSLALLTAVNCFGVRAGASTQTTFTVLKAVAIAGLIFCGLFLAVPLITTPPAAAAAASPPASDLAAFGGALVPVLFAYGGWQTACFLAGEIREPGRNLPRALILGIGIVITLYLATNVACLRVLGPSGLAATGTPASDVMRQALGEPGARLIAVGIAISTFGFLSQGMLTTPRVYYAMARDRLFFSALGRVHPRTAAPVAAILLQGAAASLLAFSGSYETILNYVVSVDFIFYGLAGCCVFIFRRQPGSRAGFRVPGHPWTTLFFIAVCWVVVLNLIRAQPAEGLKGIAILAAGLPVYAWWRRAAARTPLS